MKLGEICFLPKVKVGGEFTVDVEEMRPITLLPELGKLVNRIVAKRICRILQDHPDLLHGAQRGFVKDGNVSQCINTVLDVFEDRQEHKRKSKLFVVSYDLRKAFDSVQEYSLRAALKKMGMPAGFVKYACSMMSEAKSRVRVRHGLTRGFDIRTSVRQGDPLSPLLFIFLADVLHRGLERNPIFGGSMDGYRFHNDDTLTVSSCGFADDFIIFSESPEGIERMHAWVREFCGAHQMELNAKKTEFIAGACPKKEIPLLYDVRGVELISPLDENHVFRYLGVWIRMRPGRGAWDKQLSVMGKHVDQVRRKILCNKLDVIMAVHVVNTVLIPRLELGFKFAKPPKATLVSWNNSLAEAMLKVTPGRAAMTSSKVAFDIVTKLTHVEDAMVCARIMDVANRLNSRDRMDARTLWMRLQSAAGKGTSRGAILQAAMQEGGAKVNNRVLV